MIPVKILGKEYRIRGDFDAAHIEQVASYVDDVLAKVQRSTPDTQDAAILAALNIASELLQLRQGGAIPRERLQALIDLVDSA